MTDTIQVEGVTELVSALAKLRADIPDAVRTALGEVADTAVGRALPHIPILTGATRKSVRVEKAGTGVTVVAGGGPAGYFGGHYVEHELIGMRDDVADLALSAIAEAASRVGLDLT